MQDLNDLRLFALVAEHGGFSAAARLAGIPKSRLSRRVAQLEERLGVRLLQRSTRRFAVTEIGRAFLLHCQAVLVEADAAQAVIEQARARPSGLVRVSCSLPLLQSRVSHVVARFMAEHPAVRIQVEATGRPVDVIAEGFDMALRVRPPPLQDSELVIRVLAEDRQSLVASPAFLARHGRPQAPADLAGLPSLGLSRGGDTDEWRLVGADGRPVTLIHRPRLATDDMVTLGRAAEAGVGLVLLPDFVLAKSLADGRLERVLPAWTSPPWLVHVVFPSRRGLIPAVRGFIDALAADFADLPAGIGRLDLADRPY